MTAIDVPQRFKDAFMPDPVCTEDTKPATTAYGRMMDELVARIEALESVAVGTSGSLVDARRRIEQLERDRAVYGTPRPIEHYDYAKQDLRQQHGFGQQHMQQFVHQVIGGDGIYPNMQPQRISLLRSQLEQAVSLLRAARDCMKQCVGMSKVESGWEFASELVEADVAYWMQENPSQCTGAFDLTRLKASIKK